MNTSQNIDGKEITVKQKLFTWSNLISLSRVFVAAPIIYLHYINGQTVTTAVVILIAYGMVSDYLDGYLARTLNEVSEWGKILDPIADKVSAFFLFLYTVYIGLIPTWFFVLEISRDLLIMTGSLFIKTQRGKVAMATMSGKWSVNALAGYWMSAFFFPDLTGVQHFFMGISLALMFLSLIDYFYRFVLISKGLEFN